MDFMAEEKLPVKQSTCKVFLKNNWMNLIKLLLLFINLILLVIIKKKISHVEEIMHGADNLT